MQLQLAFEIQYERDARIHTEKVYNASLCVPRIHHHIRGTIAMEQCIKDIISIVLFSYTLIHNGHEAIAQYTQGIGEPNVHSYSSTTLQSMAIVFLCLCIHPHMHSRHSCMSRLCIVANRMWVVRIIERIKRMNAARKRDEVNERKTNLFSHLFGLTKRERGLVLCRLLQTLYFDWSIRSAEHIR